MQMVLSRKESKKLLDIERLLSEKYHLSEALLASGDIARLLHGEPLDYVIGWVRFLGVNVDLSLKPFIPRPETEYWAGRAVRNLKKLRRKPIKVLDMFAGSGCLGLAVLKHVPNSKVVFVEKDPGFIAQIKISLRKNGFQAGRFEVIRSDVFRNVSGIYDVILANPPYVGASSRLDSAVAGYEPRSAYYGGRNGLSVIRRFLKEAKHYVKPGGKIWMEHGAWQKAEIKKLFLRLRYKQFAFHKDQYGRPRYVIIQSAPRAA